MSEEAIDITLRPLGEDKVRADWSARAASQFRSCVSEERAKTRAAVGLNTDRPVIMTGHQAEWWHAGIFAKAIAADATAQACGGSTAWIIVDQDDHDPSIMRLPIVGGSPSADKLLGQVRESAWALRTRDGSGATVPTGRMPMIEHVPPPTLSPGDVLAAPSVDAGVARTISALERGRDARPSAAVTATASPAATSLALQIARALAELGSPHLQMTPAIVLATRLNEAQAFRALVRRMVDDPRACIAAYNHAVDRHPHAGIARLVAPTEAAGESDWDRAELPLWAIDTPLGSVRRRVDVREARRLLDERPETLVPRALLMTGFLRLHVCDLFIHGLGGERYDPITEEWFANWLGATLAPTTTATATLLLDMTRAPVARVVTPTEVARAKWARHRARHDPDVLGELALQSGDRADSALSLERQTLLAELAGLRRARRRPGAAGEAARRESARAYRALHALLARWRDSRREVLQTLDARAEQLDAAARLHALRADRTWFFALHSAQRLDALARAIREKFQ